MTFLSLLEKFLVASRRLVYFYRSPFRCPPQPVNFPLREKRFLVIDMGNLGDLVGTALFLREITSEMPSLSLDVISYSYGAEVLSGFKSCNFLSIDRGRPIRSYVRIIFLLLFSRRYDVSIYLRYGIDARCGTLLTFFSRAKIKVWFSELSSSGKSIRNKNYDYMYTYNVIDREVCHQIFKKVKILNLFGITVNREKADISLPLELTKEPLVKNGLKEKGYMIAWFGATEPKREWKNFESVFDSLLGETVVICGNKEESVYGGFLADKFPNVINLCGKLTLKELYSIVSFASVGVGTDTGIAHFANAAGIPFVFISCHPKGAPEDHTNSPVRFGPLSRNSIVLQPEAASEICLHSGCREKYPHCISKVAPKEVLDSVRRLIQMSTESK